MKTYFVTWVRPGGVGVTRYAGVAEIVAENEDEAVQRTRDSVRRFYLFDAPPQITEVRRVLKPWPK